MNYGAVQVQQFPPYHPPGHPESFIDNSQNVHYVSKWMATLASVQHQENYLTALLSKTAITLNALRDKHTRYERMLSFGPMPRSKKKKAQHQKWRTGKTIQTCENEERAILNCLEVCRGNKQTLVSLIHPVDTSSTAADYGYSSSHSKTPFTDSTDTCFAWNQGWAEDECMSPFQKQRRGPADLDGIPPGAYFDSNTLVDASSSANRPPPRPINNLNTAVPHAAMAAPVPSNTASSHKHHSTLSAEAESFQPRVTQHSRGDETAKVLDKLSISSFLASKRVQRLQRRRFSDAAVGYRSRRLSGGSASGGDTTRPPLASLRGHASWGLDAVVHGLPLSRRPRRSDEGKDDRAISV